MLARTSSLVVALAATVVACGGSDSETTVVDGKTVFVISEPECDDTSACAGAWIIDGRTYEPTCTASPGRRSELYAADARAGGRVRAWTIEGRDGKKFLLVPSFECSDGQTGIAVARP